jgi:hypothetical protein
MNDEGFNLVKTSIQRKNQEEARQNRQSRRNVR